MLIRLSINSVLPVRKCVGTYPQKTAVAISITLPMNSGSIIQISKKYASNYWVLHATKHIDDSIVVISTTNTIRRLAISSNIPPSLHKK